ncbi:hypothetical protein [Streptomyces sp. BA2]|uniref:hypothetical protein n=1 Tax=Streptomyces sp. BA2 TaxID=436595 RepID=UPI00132299D7|nr:hypothetical protein [Streptomyces sp. BA2]MWA08696.1 hypothetical protein [Streptomyces sp. BA2]
MNAPNYARIEIQGLCWSKKPDDVLHCTLGPAHKGDHFHAYTKTRWPNRARQPQG